jgi:hypothetical protein
LGRHVEQIALFIVPGSFEDEVDEDEEEGKDEDRENIEEDEDVGEDKDRKDRLKEEDEKVGEGKDKRDRQKEEVEDSDGSKRFNPTKLSSEGLSVVHEPEDWDVK